MVVAARAGIIGRVSGLRIVVAVLGRQVRHRTVCLVGRLVVAQVLVQIAVAGGDRRR